MARVFVHAAEVEGGELRRLEVRMGSLPRRVIDRATALAWMQDHHSLVPVIDGRPAAPLHLVEGEEDTFFIRADTTVVAEDALPALPILQG